MKALYIIESETPGITCIKVKVDNITKYFSPTLSFDIGDFTSMHEVKIAGTWKGKKIIKTYRSSWKPNEYFVRHFM